MTATLAAGGLELAVANGRITGNSVVTVGEDVYIGGAYGLASGASPTVVDFDPQNDFADQRDQVTVSGSGGFIAKYNADRELQWVRQISGAVQQLEVGRQSNDIYFHSSSASSGSRLGRVDANNVLKFWTKGDSAWGRFALDATESRAYFSQQQSHNGGRTYVVAFDLSVSETLKPLWTVAAEGEWNAPYDIAVGGAGATASVYIVGTFRGTVDFDPGSKKLNLSSGKAPAGTTQYPLAAYVWKLNASGSLASAQALTGSPTGGVVARSCELDSKGNLVVAGNYFGSVDLDPGKAVLSPPAQGRDVFVQRYAPSGALLATTALGTAQDDNVTDLALDRADNIYLFRSTYDNANSYVTKLSATFAHQWTMAFEAGPKNFTPQSLTVSSSGKVHLTGWYEIWVENGNSVIARHELYWYVLIQ